MYFKYGHYTKGVQQLVYPPAMLPPEAGFITTYILCKVRTNINKIAQYNSINYSQNSYTSKITT